METKPLPFIVDRVNEVFPDYTEEEKLRVGLEMTDAFIKKLLEPKEEWKPLIHTVPIARRDSVVIKGSIKRKRYETNNNISS